MKLKSHEEIQQFLLRPVMAPLLKRIVQGHSDFLRGQLTERERLQHNISLNRLLLKSVFGQRVFRGSHGRAFKAFAEFRPSYGLRKDKLREFGKHLSGGGQLLRFAVQFDPDHLTRFNEDEADILIHELSRVATYMRAKGEVLQRRARW